MGYSIYFDGSGDYLIANANSGSFGTADFTVEAFVKTASKASGTRTIFSNYNVLNSNSLSLFSSSFIGGTDRADTYTVAIGGSGYPNINGRAGLPNAKNYDHVALTRQANTITLYVNGNREGSACTFTGNLTHSSGNLWIGTDGSGLTNTFKGWMNGLRIIKNECLYTANFSPPTILTLTPNTTLLTCNALSLNTTTNLCIDQSNLGYSITTFGDVGVAGDGINTQNTIISVPINYSVGNNFNISLTVSNSAISIPILYNTDYTGDGKIYGVVKKRISGIDTILPNVQVFLYPQNTKVTLQSTTSNATGEFVFTGINRSHKYFVCAFDPELQKNAVIMDNLLPEQM